MTKQHKTDELDLSALYQARKEQHTAPVSIKRQVMRQATERKGVKNWFSGIQQVAIAASTLLLVGVVSVHYYRLNYGPTLLTYTSVEVHSLGTESADIAGQIRHLYAQRYEDFQQKQAMLASHHSKSAVMTQFDQGWELTTCDQSLVKVSNELIAKLKSMDMISANIQSGDNVNIQFNREGMIVGIEQTTQLHHC